MKVLRVFTIALFLLSFLITEAPAQVIFKYNTIAENGVSVPSVGNIVLDAGKLSIYDKGALLTSYDVSNMAPLAYKENGSVEYRDFSATCYETGNTFEIWLHVIKKDGSITALHTITIVYLDEHGSYSRYVRYYNNQKNK